MNNENNGAPLAPPGWGPIRWLGSIRLGITLLVLILVYASVGSALAPVRGVLEMTEMQVFHHWLFVTLVVLFSIALIVTSVTRVRWTPVHAGALIVHAGLLLLIGGSMWYFWNKVEGDVLLISPRIELLTAEGRPLPGTEFLARPGEPWEQIMPAFGGAVKLAVVGVTARGSDPIAEATVRTQFGSTQPKDVQLVANAPRGTPLGNGLALRLRTFPSQSTFYDDTTAALYYGRPGEGLTRFVPLTGLPLHRERYLPDEGVLRDSNGREVPSKRTTPHLSLGGRKIPTGWFESWRVPIRLDTPELPFDIEIRGYVPYIAGLEHAVVGGGARENPVVRFRLAVGSESVEPTLAAFDPQHAQLDLGTKLEFRWVKSNDELDETLRAGATVSGEAASRPVFIVAGPELAPLLVTFGADGAAQRMPLEVGSAHPLELAGLKVNFTLLAYERYGRFVDQPVIQPLELRRPKPGRQASAIRLRLTGRGEQAGWSETRWCTFSDYPHLALGGGLESLAAQPITVRGPDGREYALVYSRAERDLETTLVPGALNVTFFPGRRRAESWQSDFYVLADPRGTPVPAIVKTNQTYAAGPWTLFQSGAAGDHWGWTILGVGNRRGMWPMLLGCVLITAGCLYAFYVKPILRRRAAQSGAVRRAPRSGEIIEDEEEPLVVEVQR